MYNPVFSITRKKITYPQLLHICQRKPGDGIRKILVDDYINVSGALPSAKDIAMVEAWKTALTLPS